MAAGEEIDLTGLGKQIEKVSKDINTLSDNTKVAEKYLLSIGDKKSVEQLKAFSTAVSGMNKSVYDLRESLKSGEGGVNQFIDNLMKLRGFISKAGEFGALPVTGLLESLNKITSGYKGLNGIFKAGMQDSKTEASSFLKLLEKFPVTFDLIVKSYQRQNKMSEERALREKENAEWAEKHAIAEEKVEATTRKSLGSARSLSKVLQQIQREKVAEGNMTAIQSYLKNFGYSTNTISAAIDGLRNKQRNLNQATAEGREEYIKTAYQIEFLEKQLGKSVSMAERLKTTIGKVGGVISQIAMSFGIMTGVFGATNFLKSLYKITSEFQLQQKALAAIVSNAHEANILFERMKSLAVETPIKLLDLNKYAKQLSAYRVETQKLYDSLKMLGDISVGVGVDMDRLILAYGQVKAANYLRGQELRQFSEAGVNILGGLQEYYRETKNINMSINEIFDSVSKRKVLFEDVDAVLKRMTQSGGTFYNMQLIQSQTLYGQLQKLGDMFQIEMSEIGNTTRPILLGAVKLIQLIVSNLRTLLGVATTLFLSVKASKFVRNLIIAKDATGALKKQFAAAGFEVKKLEFGIGNLIKKIKVMAATSAGLKGLIAGLAVGVGITAITSVISAIRDRNQRLEELAERLTEVRKRAYEVQQIEKIFIKSNSYKDKLSALQQLADKAKEYGYNLRLAAEITPQNINEEWKKALEDFNNFNKQIANFETAYDRKRLENNLKDLARITGKQALAFGEAERDFEFYEMNLARLPETARKEFEKMKEMRDDFLKNEEDAAIKYGITQKKFENEFAKSMYNIERAISGTKLYDELAQERGISSWFRSAKSKFFEGGLFGVNDYESELKDVKRQLKKFAKDAGLTEELFKNMTPEQVKKKIEETYPAWKASLKNIPDIVKAELPTIFAEAFKTPEQVVVEVDLEYDVNNTDINDKEWVKVYRNILKDRTKDFEKYGFKYDETQGAYVVDAKVDLSMQGGVADPLQAKTIEGTLGTIGRALSSLNVSGQEDAESFKKLLKDRLSDLDDYIEQYTKQVALIKALNATFGENIEFADYEAAIDSLTAEKEIIEQIFKDLFGTLKSTTHSHHQSMKSEYQSMIDFVRELNREFDNLRKNFNEKDSERWAGATNRILSSFEAKFGAMPTRFKKAFQDTLSSIDFTTKEGTVEAENIVKGLIDSAKDLTPKEKSELQRAWGEAVGQIKLEAELELKAREDERLKAQVQKMFDDYNLTIELDKLGVDADEVGKLFNIDTKDLLTLERKLESMKEKFVGRNMEKEYRQFMRKIVEINDKANLEMAKKYVKYLREEYGERAKVELEYMRQRAEVYALPFDEGETMRILDNLQKETNEKLSKLKWDEFKSTDFYVEMFENLERVSTKSLQTMIDKLNEYKDTLKDMPAADFKAITEQINKVSEELAKRNPFKMLVDSLKQIKSAKSVGADAGDAVRKMLGLAGDADIKQFSKSLNDALNTARLKLLEFRNKLEDQGVLLGAAKDRDLAKKYFEELPEYANIKLYDEKNVSEQLDKLKEQYKTLTEEVNKELAEGRGKEEPTTAMMQKTSIKEQIDMLTKLREAYIKLGRDRYRTQADIEKDIEKTKNVVDEYNKNVDAMEETSDQLKKAALAIKLLAEDWVEAMGKVKTSFDTVFDSLDYLGGTTDQVTEAWKDLGDTIFDTVTRAISLVGEFAAAAVAGETAINAASGWIGIIAEAITLLVTGIAQIFKLKDAKIEREIDKLQRSLDKLKKTAEDLSEAFDSSYSEDELRKFDAALIRTRELAIATLKAMKEAEESKKKSDQAAIDDYQEQIDSLNKEMQEGIENFYEALGGFGSAANMKSTVEEWTDAWYEAFKETGDGLSGLEDSFEEFFENIVKKTLMNNIMAKYFGDKFLASLDTILGTEGGVMGNLDALNDWITQYHDLAVQADEEMQAATQAIQNVTGIGGNLEGLQAGLQGMTEETADILAAYLNSVRFYVADNNQLLQNLLNGLTIDNNSNPMLQQLKIVAAQTTSINLLLDSVVHSGGYQGNGGGSYLKVHAILES